MQEKNPGKIGVRLMGFSAGSSPHHSPLDLTLETGDPRENKKKGDKRQEKPTLQASKEMIQILFMTNSSM